MIDESSELEALRETTRALRREPDAEMIARVRENVRARIAVPPSLWEILAGWIRPAAVSVAAIVAICFALFTLAPEPISPRVIAESVLVEWEVALARP